MRALKTSLCAGVLMTLYPGIGFSQATFPEEATDDEAVVLEASDLESALDALRVGQLSRAETSSASRCCTEPPQRPQSMGS